MVPTAQVKPRHLPIVTYGPTNRSIGTVVAAARKDDPLISRRVFLVPMRGWESHSEAPESR